MINQLDVPVALSPVPNLWEAGWVPEPVWTGGDEKIITVPAKN
jgi:hypothetical protein